MLCLAGLVDRLKFAVNKYNLLDADNNKYNIIIMIIIISKTMFMVLSSWQSHCESSPGSFATVSSQMYDKFIITTHK